jgi:uncharacterized cupredoxin-like copper-binding protein
MRLRAIHSTVAIAAAATAAITPAGLAAPDTQLPAHASAAAVSARGREFSFALSKRSVAKPGKVTFSFHNVGTVKHDFKINGKRTPLIGPGKTARLAVTFHKKGRYTFICTVPGHAAAGMRGVFIVR